MDLCAKGRIKKPPDKIAEEAGQQPGDGRERDKIGSRPETDLKRTKTTISRKEPQEAELLEKTDFILNMEPSGTAQRQEPIRLETSGMCPSNARTEEPEDAIPANVPEVAQQGETIDLGGEARRPSQRSESEKLQLGCGRDCTCVNGDVCRDDGVWEVCLGCRSVCMQVDGEGRDEGEIGRNSSEGIAHAWLATIRDWMRIADESPESQTGREYRAAYLKDGHCRCEKDDSTAGDGVKHSAGNGSCLGCGATGSRCRRYT